MAILSKVTGEIIKIAPKRGKSFTRPELYSYVGIDFEIIELMSGDLMLTPGVAILANDFATKLAHREVSGNVLIVEPGELDD